MFLQQADLLQDTRSLLINSSIMQISQDNDELKQSVRIADNELKIIMLTDQVHRIRITKMIFLVQQTSDRCPHCKTDLKGTTSWTKTIPLAMK